MTKIITIKHNKRQGCYIKSLIVKHYQALFLDNSQHFSMRRIFPKNVEVTDGGTFMYSSVHFPEKRLTLFQIGKDLHIKQNTIK